MKWMWIFILVMLLAGCGEANRIAYNETYSRCSKMCENVHNKWYGYLQMTADDIACICGTVHIDGGG